MSGTIAQLHGSNLEGAGLQGALLTIALLQNVNLEEARLQGAHLMMARLQGANLKNAKLQGANFLGASLQGTNLWGAQLQGSDLREAQLEGSALVAAKLQGADLRSANLQGAKLLAAELQGANLTGADLYGAIHLKRGTALVEVRSARWTPLTEERLAEMREVLTKTIADTDSRKEALERIERAGKAGLPPPILNSCLIDPEVTLELNCKEKWLLGQIDAFRSELFPVLEKLACQSSWIAGGLVQQIDQSETTSGRFGLAERFADLLADRKCKGLTSLPEAGKDMIRRLAKQEEEQHRRQSGTDKPAKEAPAPPAPSNTPESP